LIPLRVIAFTHKSTPLKELNRYFIPDENRMESLTRLKNVLGLDELMYVATCNRIEFVCSSSILFDANFLLRFISVLHPDWSEEQLNLASNHALVFEGYAALEHLFRVASSLDSLVVGEREIITQVRKSYDQCKSAGLTGDLIRLAVQATINSAKRVYTETKIAAQPVSVVSLADRQLRVMKLPPDSRVLVIGAGETNTNLCKYMLKQGFRNFTVFNRTVENAHALANMLQSEKVFAQAFALTELPTYSGGFDLMVTCTGSATAVVSKEMYEVLLAGERNQKVLIDLAMPADIDPDILSTHDVRHIGMEALKSTAEKNLVERKSELKFADQIIEEQVQDFHRIIKTRNLELRMRDVPDKFREIRERALNDVFAHEIESLDEHSKAILEKVINYMEKKYISVPMVMAKEILLEKQ
jgi:glutamyl-tRNA reductase